MKPIIYSQRICEWYNCGTKAEDNCFRRFMTNWWDRGECTCLSYIYHFSAVAVTASAYTLAAIAFERYHAICSPLRSRNRKTRSHAYAMISLVWIIALSANIFMLFMYEEKNYKNGLTCAPKQRPLFHFLYQVNASLIKSYFKFVVKICVI